MLKWAMDIKEEIPEEEKRISHISSNYPDDPDEGKKAIVPKMDYTKIKEEQGQESSTNPNNIAEGIPDKSMGEKLKEDDLNNNLRPDGFSFSIPAKHSKVPPGNTPNLPKVMPDRPAEEFERTDFTPDPLSKKEKKKYNLNKPKADLRSKIGLMARTLTSKFTS